MTLYRDYSDELLFWLLKMGNEMAFNTIYERYRKRIFIEIQLRLQEEEEASYLMQEVFMWLWNKRKTIQVSNTLKSCLITAASNKTTDILQEKQLLASYRVQYNRLTSIFNKGLAVNHKGRDRMLQMVLDLISPAGRMMLIQKYIYQKSMPEIAIDMGVSIKSVNLHLRQAMAILYEQKNNLRRDRKSVG